MFKVRTIIIFLYLLVCFSFFSQSTQDIRGLKNLKIDDVADKTNIGKQWVFIIAINEYSEWNNLAGPKKDAHKFREVLINNYYIDNIVELYDKDATKSNILRSLSYLQEKVGVHDSVLIYYAGHGYLDTKSDEGFWIPSNSGTDNFEQKNWIPNSVIKGYLDNMKTRHLLLISDSCFGGSLLNLARGKTPEITSEYFINAYKKVSRQVLTSGSLETVKDDSPFARQLILSLEGNTFSVIDPLMLFTEIRSGISGQTPLYGDIKNSAHQEGASFLLFKRDDKNINQPMFVKVPNLSSDKDNIKNIDNSKSKNIANITIINPKAMTVTGKRIAAITCSTVGTAILLTGIGLFASSFAYSNYIETNTADFNSYTAGKNTGRGLFAGGMALLGTGAVTVTVSIPLYFEKKK